MSNFNYDSIDYRDIYDDYKQSNDFSRWRLNSAEDIEGVAMDLRGLEFNEDLNKFIRVSDPLMNETGVQQVKSILRSRMTRFAGLTDLSEETINKFSKTTAISVNRLLFVNADKYGVRPEEYLEIYEMIKFNVFMMLTKSKNAGERNALIRQESIIRQIKSEDKEKKFMGLFSRGNKNQEEEY